MNNHKVMANFDNIQIQRSLELSFNSKDLYCPKNGDNIYTLDVKYEDQKAIVGIDIFQLPTISVQTFQIELGLPNMPYQPQYFAFYEGPVIVEAIKKIAGNLPQPNLIIVDGHGIAHPRGFGLACYVGLELDLPCIGIAKGNLLPFSKDLIASEKFATYTFRDADKELGVAIRLQENVNPVFISPGHKISLATSIEIIKNLTTTFRLPDNIRRADQASRSNL